MAIPANTWESLSQSGAANAATILHRHSKPLTCTFTRQTPYGGSFNDHPAEARQSRDFSLAGQQSNFRLTCNFRKAIPMQNRNQPPSHLRKTGKAAWRRLVAENDFSAAEFVTLELLCAQLDTLDKLDVEMATMAVVTAGSEGQPVVNPILRERRETIKQIDSLMVALAIPIDGEAYGVRRSGSARAAAKTRKPPKTNVNTVSHLRGGA